MKKTALLGILLVSQIIWADQQPLSITEDRQPVQQFVTSDPTEDPETVKSDTPADDAETQSVSSADSLPLPPTPTFVPAQQPIPGSTAIALGLNAPKKDTPDNVLVGGFDIPSFIQCKQIYTNICRTIQDPNKLDTCIKKIVQSECKPFIAFVKATSMSPRDDVDMIKHYKQLDLIHLVRFGANYPGVYYTLGTNGDLVDLIFGPQTQGLDIRKDIHYAEIAEKYPKVMLFSIVDKLPKVTSTTDGKGLRLILRFQLLNGCHACEQAGFAKVAYDFSEVGALQSTSIQSMEPLF
jgi:hypothetical protein